MRDPVITVRTRNRCTAAVSKFFHWVNQQDQVLGDCLLAFDALVSAYLEHIWSAGDSKAWANDVCSGLQHFVPGLKGRLNGSWRLLKAWGRVEIPNRACPMTLGIFQAFTGLALKERLLEVAIVYCLCFQGLLRPS